MLIINPFGGQPCSKSDNTEGPNFFFLLAVPISAVSKRYENILGICSQSWVRVQVTLFGGRIEDSLCNIVKSMSTVETGTSF